MCTSRYAYQAPSSMLRARRRDANVRPNRWLDKKSSRGMLFENEELRLRTIEINAEVERGQGDVKKLKRQNEQLRREIWNLRDAYDQLEERMRQMRGDDEYLEEEEEIVDEEEETYDSDEEKNTEKKCDVEDADNIQNAHLASAKLLGLREEGAGCEASAPSPPPPEPPPPLTEGPEREPKEAPDLIVLSQQNTKEVIHRRDSVRRRTFGGEIPTATEPSPAGVRLSLPVSGECREGAGDLLNQHQVNENPLGTTSEPWWLLASVEPDMSSAGYRPSSLSSPVQNTPWTPQSDSAAAWAITPFNQNQQPTFPARFRRRAPPPPPPKPPSCEQVTVRRASSVLPDGTTRRSVTFHADSVTYIPPTQQCVYIPANCVCDQQDDKQEEGETRLLVRGLDRVPGMAPRELIDALEQRLGGESLRESVRGVCLHHQARPAIAATVSVGQREVALRLLAAGLEARGEALEVEEENAALTPSRWQPHGDVSDPSHVLLVSGVTHKVSDAAVRAAVMRACGLRASQVCRHVYKGVDTGERLVRVTTGCPSLALQQSETTEPLTENSVETSAESKFRSHLKVKLKPPAAKTPETPPTTRPTKLKLSGNVPPPPPPRAPSTPQQTPVTPNPPSPKVIGNGPVSSPPPYTPPPPPTRAPSISRTESEVHEESPKQQRGSVSFESPPGGVVTAQPQVTTSPQSQSVRKKASSAQMNGGILRRSEDAHNPMRRAGKSRSVSVESSRVGNPQRRRHGVFERPSEDLLLEARGSFEDTPRTLHIPPKGPALPWCACWGNGCI